MLYYRKKPIIFDIDDFCEHYMSADRWQQLHELKKIYPNLKITMFTIPLLCNKNWLKMVNKEYTWIEMHYHGSSHEDRDEWFSRTEFQMPYPEYFYRGFKAPWWRMNQTTATTLDKYGYLISACQGWFDIEAQRVYRFNTGTKRFRSIWHENQHHHSIHCHVQSQKLEDGLPDGGVFEMISTTFPKHSKFLFISEMY